MYVLATVSKNGQMNHIEPWNGGIYIKVDDCIHIFALQEAWV